MGVLGHRRCVLVRRRHFVASACGSLGLVLTRAGWSASGGPPLVVIVGEASEVRNVHLAQLRRAFLGRPVVLGDQRLIPFNHQVKTEPRTSFDRRVLEMSPEEVGRYWIERRIQGGAKPPRTVPNASLLRRLVNGLPGSIGYVLAEDVDRTVKVLLVDGKAPGEAGYPL